MEKTKFEVHCAPLVWVCTPGCTAAVSADAQVWAALWGAVRVVADAAEAAVAIPGVSVAAVVSTAAAPISAIVREAFIGLPSSHPNVWYMTPESGSVHNTDHTLSG
ncbi:hypothetical protein GCM10022222_40420 [Amycolatopsis ultiminotia]|uniref:Uncharacterized protein n=1 Tax=Amycolatopsis ultiminotia TaxID=543629 RepID=A0ABP6WM41_9PSEU